MDIKMKAETITEQIEWDCKVSNGEAVLAGSAEEELQCATIAGFLVKGSVPQLPEVGVPWTDFLQKKITFGELDFYVRESLKGVEKDTYYPQYDIQSDRLTMSIGRLDSEDAA